MHLFDLFSGVPFGGQERFDGFVHHRRKRDDVSQRDKWSGLDVIRLVLLGTLCVPQRDFLLIIQPILIIWTEARIQNPLLKFRRLFSE